MNVPNICKIITIPKTIITNYIKLTYLTLLQYHNKIYKIITN